MKVLVADDSIVSRHLLDVTLRNWGYDVIGASNGTAAWEILSGSEAPSLAILDWMMPGLTGPEICQRMRDERLDQYTYVILLTARSQKEDIVMGMESGADDYLTKPFEQAELQVRLRAGKRIVELHAELLRAREAIQHEASRDSLTGLFNRGTILAMLQRELARGSREVRPLGVVMADLDHFKNVNDSYGHLVGDQVLSEAARRMQDVIRAYDAIGRYGGEEFLILLPGCHEDTALEQAERMRRVLSAAPIMIGDIAYELSGSFGVASVVPSPATSSEQLIRRADQAMYLAKSRGRNRCETSQKTDAGSGYGAAAFLSHVIA